MDDAFLQALLSGADEQTLLTLSKGSSVQYVRSIDQIAEYHPEATGRVLTAFEALSAYRSRVLYTVAIDGYAPLSESPSAAGQLLKERRQVLNLEIQDVSTRAGLDERIVAEAESSKRLPIRYYERIARSLGLDERYVSVRSEPVPDSRIAVRLRRIGTSNPRMTPTAVTAISEAAWVAQTQVRLEEQLGIFPPKTTIEPSPNYGRPGYPPYKHGYFLAYDARDRLGFGDGPLPKMLRELCEEILLVPLIQAELGEQIAGVTVQAGNRRAIVLNISGRNRDVLVRRSTIAHELGHLLYDDSENLQGLQVDEYEDLEKSSEQLTNPVEQRANAFSAEFIAPQKAVVECYERTRTDPVGEVMRRFGVSFTVARNQLWNGLSRGVPIDSLTTIRENPPDSFESGESYNAGYRLISDTPVTRSGRFSAVVLRATDETLISWQTACEYMNCDEKTLRQAADSIKELFPTVFESSR